MPQHNHLSQTTDAVPLRAESWSGTPPLPASPAPAGSTVALLTGGGDKPYALGLSAALQSAGVCHDFIGSDDLDSPALHDNPWVHFFNLRGDQRSDVSVRVKVMRVLAYYAALLKYAFQAKPKIFHILWNNKIEWLDRTALMFYYRFLGKRIVLTAHNVNARQRDGGDTWWNRFSLRMQYQLAYHIFVHTEKMKQQLADEFGVSARKVAVIPFGINNTVPQRGMTMAEARRQLGLPTDEQILLVYGNIAPYKGIEYAVEALAVLRKASGKIRLIVAGKPKACAAYWASVQEAIVRQGVEDAVTINSQFIPDDETELYFKAADVLLLPYTHVYQSGVLFLSYAFGLPVIAADVGSLKEEIVPGRTGFVCQPTDAADLARAVGAYFESDLYRDLEHRRADIRDYANDRYSWATVARITSEVYTGLLAE